MSIVKKLSVSVSLLAVAACTTVGPNYSAPDTLSLTPTELEGDATLNLAENEPANEWWQSFGDDILTGLVRTAHANNRDLAEAAANVQAARAIYQRQRVNNRPTGEVTSSYQYQRPALAGTGIDGLNVDATDLASVGAVASWELDFFGRIKRLNEAARANLEAAEWLRRDAQVLVAAETAIAYIDLRIAESGIQLARRNLSIQRETLNLTQVRLAEGLGSNLDVSRAKTQTQTTDAAIRPFEIQQASALNRLATLTGQPVTSIEEIIAVQSPSSHFSVPDTLAIGNIETLMKRRADIRAADRELAAATANIGVATADYFPRISLVGNVVASATSVSGFGDSNAVGFGVGPSISWSGFDRGLVGAQVALAEANNAAALARFEQTVLTALEDTQTALAAYGREKIRLQALDKAVENAVEAASLARLRYDEGVDDFLNVLDAEARRLAVEVDRLSSQQDLATGLVDIYRALGAGWQIG